MVIENDDNSEIELQPELLAVIDALNKYIEVNNGNVVIIGEFCAFDCEGKVKVEATRSVAHGLKKCLEVELEDLWKSVMVVDEDFINW